MIQETGYELGHKEVERFHNNYIVGKDTECWNWKLVPNSVGYGHLNVGKKCYLAHRVSYILHKGHIDKGLVVRHKCDNPRCVNPNHLELGTQADNQRDKKERGRTARQYGMSNGYAKLSDREVLEIYDLATNKIFSQNKIAHMYGIAQSWVSRIKHHGRSIIEYKEDSA